MFPDLFRNEPAAKGTDSAEEAIQPDEAKPPEKAAPPEEAAPADRATSGREIASIEEGNQPQIPEPPEEPHVKQYGQSGYKEIYLPFSAQHELVAHLQKYLEAVCYTYGQKNMPEILKEHGWNCHQAVQLNTWMDEFIVRQEAFNVFPDDGKDGSELEGLFRSVARIRDTAVCRTATDNGGVKRLVAHAVLLVDILGVEHYKNIINDIQSGVDKAVDDLSREERTLQEQREKELAHIAEKRVKLDVLEKSVLVKAYRKSHECQRLAGLEVQKVLDEAEKEFRIERFLATAGDPISGS